MDFTKYSVDIMKLPHADCMFAPEVLDEMYPTQLRAAQEESRKREAEWQAAKESEEARLAAQFRHDAETELEITHWPDDLKAVLYDIIEGFASLEEKFGAMWNIVKFTKIYSGIIHCHPPTKMPCEKPVLRLGADRR